MAGLVAQMMDQAQAAGAAVGQAGGQQPGAGQAPAGNDDPRLKAMRDDPQTMAVLQLMQEQVDSPAGQQMVMQALQQGAQDLEMAIAELGANLLRSAMRTVKGMGRELPLKVLSRLAMAVTARLCSMAVQAGMLEEGQRKALAQRALMMTVHLVKNGPGSLK